MYFGYSGCYDVSALWKKLCLYWNVFWLDFHLIFADFMYSVLFVNVAVMHSGGFVLFISWLIYLALIIHAVQLFCRVFLFVCLVTHTHSLAG